LARRACGRSGILRHCVQRLHAYSFPCAS
jgi:hypothetical protein